MNGFTWFAVLLSTATADGCWTRYMQSVAKGHKLPASVWSAAIIVIGSISIVSYVENTAYIIPAALGAFVGTYVSMLTTPEELQ